MEKKKPIIEQHFSPVKLLVASLSLCCFELCFSCLSSFIVTISQAIERLYDLNVGTTPVEDGAPHEKPHKPLLLLAVFDQAKVAKLKVDHNIPDDCFQ